MSMKPWERYRLKPAVLYLLFPTPILAEPDGPRKSALTPGQWLSVSPEKMERSTKLSLNPDCQNSSP